MGRQPTCPTGLRTELDCPTLSPGLLGHPRRRRWMFSTLRHHSLSLLQCTRRHNLLTQITSHRSALAPNSIHSEPFSPQPTDLQTATECPPTTIQREQDLPLRIPAPSCIPHWPQHLFPRQGDFARHMKRQQHERFRSSLSSEQSAKFNAIGRHMITLHKRFHSLIEQNSKNSTLAINLTVLTDMLQRAQQAGLHKFHLSLVRHTTSSCNLPQRYTINIRPMRNLG